VSNEQIREIIEFAVNNTPSAFNSQSSRVVLMFNDEHRKLWEIVKKELRKLTGEDAFAKTEEKINNSFSCGYGTVLFFEEQNTIESLQKSFPSYAQNFPIWSEQTNGMLQFAVWTLLGDAGLGASLQHYNPLIDKEIQRTWNIPETWKLRAQMPFGIPTAQPAGKDFLPIEEKMKVFY
jgi:predicted oxidoreductase (fatty acid repression mutant protein)